MEKKAKLYEQLKHGRDALEDDELNDKYLINFQVTFIIGISFIFILICFNFQKKIIDKVEDMKSKKNSLKVLDDEMYPTNDSNEDWLVILSLLICNSLI